MSTVSISARLNFDLYSCFQSILGSQKGGKGGIGKAVNQILTDSLDRDFFDFEYNIRREKEALYRLAFATIAYETIMIVSRKQDVVVCTRHDLSDFFDLKKIDDMPLYYPVYGSQLAHFVMQNRTRISPSVLFQIVHSCLSDAEKKYKKRMKNRIEIGRKSLAELAADLSILRDNLFKNRQDAKVITLKVSPSVRDRVKKVAASRKQSVASTVRDCIMSYVLRKKTFRDRLEFFDREREFFYFTLKLYAFFRVLFGYRGGDILKRIQRKTDEIFEQNDLETSDHLLRYSIFIEQLIRTVILERSKTVNGTDAIRLFEKKLQKLESFYRGRLLENIDNEESDEADLDFF